MEESIGSHYALQVALHTLKERCQQFQERLTELEEENVKLRLKTNNSDANTNSLSEIDKLRQKVAELTEQKAQLNSNIVMVANENKHLWTRLSKLTQLKKTLGSKLSKVTNNSESFVIKSDNSVERTTCNSEKLLDVNDKISLDLEDISLKLISNIAKEKSELESQCSQMVELQNMGLKVDNAYGFSYLNDDGNDSTVKDFENHLQELKNVKSFLLQQKEELQKNLKNLENIKNNCNECQENTTERDNKSTFTSLPRNLDFEEQLQLESLSRWATPENSGVFIEKKEFSYGHGTDKICPMCTKTFSHAVCFEDFQDHVESHFVES